MHGWARSERETSGGPPLCMAFFMFDNRLKDFLQATAWSRYGAPSVRMFTFLSRPELAASMVPAFLHVHGMHNALLHNGAYTVMSMVLADGMLCCSDLTLSLGGAYFGTTFAHLFMLQHHDLVRSLRASQSGCPSVVRSLFGLLCPSIVACMEHAPCRARQILSCDVVLLSRNFCCTLDVTWYTWS